MRFLVTACVVLVGACFSKPGYDGSRDGGPTVDGPTVDGPPLGPCAWRDIPGLRAYLWFDDATGDTAADQSSESNEGLLVGATWTSPGRINGAVGFSQNDNLVNLASSPSLDDIGALTVCAWINLEACLAASA